MPGLVGRDHDRRRNRRWRPLAPNFGTFALEQPQRAMSRHHLLMTLNTPTLNIAELASLRDVRLMLARRSGAVPNPRAGVGMTTESLARDGRGAALRDRSGHFQLSSRDVNSWRSPAYDTGGRSRR